MLKIFLKKLRLILKKIIITFFSKIILFSLYYYQSVKNKKIIYSNSLGFGDNIMFYIHHYLKIKKNNLYVFQFCKQIDQPLNFFFEKKKILIPIVSIPFSLYYPIISEVKKSKIFTPFMAEGELNYILARKNKDSIKNLFELKLKDQKVSDNLEKFFDLKYRYICFFIKLNFDKNDINGSNSRATWDKKKIFNLLSYLISEKYIIVVLGLKNDPSIKIIREYVSKFKLKDRILFLIDLSDNYNFIDQLLLAKNSIGYLGNGSGVVEIFYYLQKKALVFDHSLISYLLLPHFKKYRKTLFKKYIGKDEANQKILSEKNINRLLYEKNEYEIIENSFEEIIYEIKNYLT